MTAARMAREALEGKRGWLDAVLEEVKSALLSSADCRELALRLASGGGNVAMPLRLWCGKVSRIQGSLGCASEEITTDHEPGKWRT